MFEAAGTGCLLACYVLVCLASFLLSLDHSDHHLRFVPQAVPKAIGWAMLFSVVSFVFMVARFSFGYFISFYFYTVIFGFVLLSWFTDFIYDHETARASAMVSFVAFMLPATLLSAPISTPTLSADIGSRQCSARAKRLRASLDETTGPS